MRNLPLQMTKIVRRKNPIKTRTEKSILGNESENKKTDMDTKNGQMARIMKGIERRIRFRVKVSSSTLMRMSMKGNGKQIKQKEKVFTTMRTGQSMRDSG